MYADDCSLVLTGDNESDLQNNLNRVTQEFITWSKANNLIYNADKTVLVQFYNRSMPQNVYVKLETTTLHPSTSFNLLGLRCDNQITWHDHIDHVVKKINSAFYAIINMRDRLDKQGMLQLYYALVYSHFTYNITIWGGASNTEKILKAQKRVLRLIFKLDYQDSCRPIFLSHKIFTFYSAYIFKCILQTRNNLANFKLMHSTRNDNIIVYENHSSAMYENFSAYAGKRFYNKLPKNIRQKPNFETFKTATKDLLLSHPVYSINEFLNLDLR